MSVSSPASGASADRWSPRLALLVAATFFMEFLDGTVLDYRKEGLNEGFKFDNPNVKGQCGCGESFTV